MRTEPLQIGTRAEMDAYFAWLFGITPCQELSNVSIAESLDHIEKQEMSFGMVPYFEVLDVDSPIVGLHMKLVHKLVWIQDNIPNEWVPKGDTENESSPTG